MNIIILGDRYKRGMKSKGCVGLIKINNTTNIFQKQYETIKKFIPQSNIVYISGFESKKFTSFLKKNHSYTVEHIENTFFAKTNTGFSLSLAQKYIKDNCLIIDGSTSLSDNLLKNICSNLNNNLLCVGNKVGEIGCILNKNIVDSLSVDLDNKVYDIVYMSGATSNALRAMIATSYHNAFLFEIINHLIDMGHIFTHKTFNKPQLCYH